MTPKLKRRDLGKEVRGLIPHLAYGFPYMDSRGLILHRVLVLMEAIYYSVSKRFTVRVR